MTTEKLQAWVLRLAGIVEILAFFAVVMPRSWMETSHSWLGMGEMPDGPLVMFMIRQASYAYGMHGVSLWLLATDVRRYRLLVVFNGVAFLLAMVVFAIIDYFVGMPIWWTISDVVGCGFVGLALLLLDRRISSSMNQ
jgi:hypothetical protein